MKLTRKNIINGIIIITGLILTQSCGGQQGEESSGLNAGSTAGVTASSTVAGPSEMNVGDIFQLVLPQGQKAVIDMAGIAADAEFDLAVVNFSTTGAPSTVQLSTDLSTLTKASEIPGEETVWEESSAQEMLEEQLRGVELVLSTEVPPVSGGASVSKGVRTAPVPALGATEVFSVLGSVGKTGRTAEVTGRVACVTDHTIFYVDVEVERGNPTDLTGRDVERLCRDFERTLVAEMALFGEPSDVNGDGHVAILLTPQVNRLGSSQGGIVTGFFFANDLYAGNKREMLYIMVPDSAGAYGTVIEKEFAMSNLIPAVLPHEMQHAISYNQHVIAGGGRPEESWLNEGLSHLAEDVLGVGIENPSRYALYLSRPEAYGLVMPGSPGLAERGGIFLFLRYLYEQHPDGAAFLRALLHSGKTGVANVEAAFASTAPEFDQFAEFLLRWSATLAFNNRGVSADPRFSYAARQPASNGYLEGVCTICDPGDNRDTVLSGVRRNSLAGKMGISLEAAAVQYYQLADPPARLNLAAPAGSSFGVVLLRTR